MEGVDFIVSWSGVLLQYAHGNVYSHLSEGVELLNYLGFVFLLSLLLFDFEFIQKFRLGLFDSFFEEFWEA